MGKVKAIKVDHPRVSSQRLGAEPKFVAFDTIENVVIMAAMGRQVMRLTIAEAYVLHRFLGEVLPDPDDLIA